MYNNWAPLFASL